MSKIVEDGFLVLILGSVASLGAAIAVSTIIRLFGIDAITSTIISICVFAFLIIGLFLICGLQNE